MSNSDRDARLRTANDFLAYLSRAAVRLYQGRHPRALGRLLVDGGGRLHWYDGGSKQRLPCFVRGVVLESRRLSGNGHLRDLVRALACYVRSGTSLPQDLFCRWATFHWGGYAMEWGGRMERAQARALALGLLAPDHQRNGTAAPH